MGRAASIYGIKIRSRFLAQKHERPLEGSLERLWQTWDLHFEGRYLRKGTALKCVSALSVI
jgi:hypothetical protein